MHRALHRLDGVVYVLLVGQDVMNFSRSLIAILFCGVSATALSAAEPAASSPAEGGVAGRIVLDGKAPALDPFVKAGDPKVKDKEVCGVVDVPDESLVVGEGNGIANVFVYLRRAPKGYKVADVEEPVVMDQKGCVFVPHTSLIRVGQPVLVKSSDAVQHNVHTFPGRNNPTNLLINPNEDTGVELKYQKPESDPVQVKCDIHAWMVSWHLVLDHPFMAVTDKDGNFKIDGLPAGVHELRIWHERGGLLEKGLKVTVKAGADAPVELKYAVSKFPAK